MEKETNKTKQLLMRAVAAFGPVHQANKCIEECSELIDALIKDMDGREPNVITEIADVYITVAQLTLMYGEDEVRAEISRKLHRLETIVSEKEKLINKKNHGINN